LPFDDGGALLRNANPLLGQIAGVEGLHVGTAAGSRVAYHAVISATRGPLRLAVVVLGAADSDARFRAAVDLLEWGFAHYERVDVVKRGERLNLRVGVEGGSVEQVTPVAGATFSVLRQRGEERNFELRYQLPTSVTAPLERDQQIGEIIIEEHGQVAAVIPALSNSVVPAVGVLSASLH
jgi:D-alanyl-D-alanine carboxypeptidase (penicillin-binding protein 5/6)